MPSNPIVTPTTRRKRSKPNRKKLIKSVVDAAKPAKPRIGANGKLYAPDNLVWDTQLKGFGLQIKPSGHKTYIIQYRNSSAKVRRLNLGAHGKLTPQQARVEAKIKLGDVERGADPVEDLKVERRAGSVHELTEFFLVQYPKDRELAGKPLAKRTLDEYGRILRNYVTPLLGSKKARALDEEDISWLRSQMSSTPYQANRVLAVVSKMMNWAESKKIRSPYSNPCRNIERFPETPRKDRLDADDLSRLGLALEALVEVGPERKGRGGIKIERTAPQERADRQAAAAIRLLLFTGCRLSKVLTLQWSFVDWGRKRIDLPYTKTGEKRVPLTAPAMEVLSSLRDSPEKPSSDYVFPGNGSGGYRNDGLKRPWSWVREQAQLEGHRIHSLRHTFGSKAADANYGLPMIAHLLGHRQTSTSERYIKPNDDPTIAAAERVAGELAADLKREKSGEVHDMEPNR